MTIMMMYTYINTTLSVNRYHYISILDDLLLE